MLNDTLGYFKNRGPSETPGEANAAYLTSMRVTRSPSGATAAAAYPRLTQVPMS